MNFEPNEDLNMKIAQEVALQGWTVAEIEAAERVIPNDAELGKQAGYRGTVTTDVFAQAKLDPRVMAGRLLSRVEQMKFAIRMAPGSRHWQKLIMEKAFRVVRINGSPENQFHLNNLDVIKNIPF